jgi:proteasome assembly chaperone (PAC2) family protein
MKFCGAKPLAELYSPSFPDYVSVSAKGICHLPRYEFYAAPTEKNDFIIMTGDTQPSFDDVIAHYALCSETSDFIQNSLSYARILDCKPNTLKNS